MKTHDKKWRLIGYPHGPGAAEQPLNEAAFDEFVDETITKTYAKARIDQLKLLLIALLTALAPLTFYRGRGRPKQLSKWLKDLWDPFTCGTISGLILLVSIPWEMLAIDRIWYFSPRVIWGPRLFNLPVEELAFFIIDGLLVGSLALLLGEKSSVRA